MGKLGAGRSGAVRTAQLPWVAGSTMSVASRRAGTLMMGLFGASGSKCVWVAKPGGLLAAISPQEGGLITSQDQKMFLLTGITVAGKKCGVICDSLLVDEGNVLDVRSKGSDSRSICIGKTPKALILLMGEKGVHGGALNQKVHDMIVGMKA